MDIKSWRPLLVVGWWLLTALPARAELPALPDEAGLQRLALQALADSRAQGLAMAVIDRGQVVRVGAWGRRNAAGEPLRTDTVMYGASLTKAVFGYTVMQLVEAGRLTLDRPLAEYLTGRCPTTPMSAAMAAGRTWPTSRAGAS